MLPWHEAGYTFVKQRAMEQLGWVERNGGTVAGAISKKDVLVSIVGSAVVFDRRSGHRRRPTGPDRAP